MVQFKDFPKISRLLREIVITEKIDGANSAVVIDKDGSVFAQSRYRIMAPDDDSSGFAKWVSENEDQLRTLGPGHHFGEWWGYKIQRGYGLNEGDRRFSLFNVGRWAKSFIEGDFQDSLNPKIKKQKQILPECCDLVPVIYRGEFSVEPIKNALEDLKINGSKCSPGFKNPEGIVVFHTHSNCLFKVTLNGDGHKNSK